MKRWIANIFTGGNLLLGFGALLLAIGGHVSSAGWLMILAAVCDAFDGKAARFFGKGSLFGVYFDSQADMVSFGVAPAVLVYKAGLSQWGLWGFVFPGIAVLLTAIRLARFNLHASSAEHDYRGLTAPLHACLVASFVIMCGAVWGEIPDVGLLAGLLIGTSLLMISSLPLPRLPRLTFKGGSYNSSKLLFLLLVIGVGLLNPARHAFSVIAITVISAFTAGIIREMMVRSATPSEPHGVERKNHNLSR